MDGLKQSRYNLHFPFPRSSSIFHFFSVLTIYLLLLNYIMDGHISDNHHHSVELSATEELKEEKTLSPSTTRSKSLRFTGAESNKFHESVVVWRHLNKFVDVITNNESQKKQILHDVSGYAVPGEVIALMGPSGSGKTTLLNVLGGRALSNTTGEIFINGKRFDKSMRKQIAYVMQEDIFFTNLTVKEQLTFTSRLRLPDTVSAVDKAAAVDNVIKTLAIKKCEDTQICLVSGGEKKRCNIGTELLTNPSVMLLDEPTSGLDSTAAASLMKTMRLLANDRMTIIMSIHQPSSNVFYSFDHLVLLADGHTAYYGAPQNCLSYLATLKFVPPCDYNPADFVMDLVNANDSTSELLVEESHVHLEGETLSPRTILIKKWDNSATLAIVNGKLSIHRAVSLRSSAAAGNTASELANVEDGLNSESNTLMTIDDDGSSGYATSYSTQFRVLLDRAFRNSTAQLFTFLNVFQCLAISLLCGLVWYQMPQSESSIQDRGGFIFFFMVYWFFNSMFNGMMEFFPERTVLTKERAAGSYHLSAYFITKNLSETPLVLSLPSIFLAICYPMANLNHSVSSFFGMLCTQLLATTCAESLGLLIGTSTTDMKVAITTATIVGLAFMLVGGYFAKNVPDFVLWFKYLSPVKYSYDACIQFEFTGNTPCDGGAVLAACLDEQSASREQVLEYFNTQGTIGFNMGMLVALPVSFRLASYLCLRFLQHNQGRK